MPAAMPPGYGSFQNGAYPAPPLDSDEILGKPKVGLRGQPYLAQFAAIAKKPDFLVTWLLPWAIFTGNLLLYAYGFMQLPALCITLTVALCFGGLALVSMASKGHLWLPLGVTMLVATVTSVVAGLYIYDAFTCQPAFYRNARLYRNVVASEPAMAVADAGKLTFTNEASIDVNRSVAYISESGFVYCIAPIRDNTVMPQVEFWAVGVGCCNNAMGDFACDAAGDPTAKAGIRIFDNSGWFQDSRKDFYRLARQKAEATYSMVSAPSPLYVRWVREDQLDMLSNFYTLRAVGNLLTFIFMYFVAAGILSFALYKERRRPS
mmetsp:Transcript_45056/g.96699  ORF Transcript_45056/g.96699 Transcript_45056/m.96699 type:complete len:320 (-) Transcript_45056:14-973(-)|eukprot:CAMPEP_0206612502 /NCGR_PEP_ID=MMETSP0325_2-20121206/56034_1 /ASSEMBLY_ACC=CAM_ASM_000347 /TAXON_ID=2866 /ORGANISM="Crypthecodinium cohnii, Strain Seligo" /LENGTH=319 /DNA_ID=CAMNT_0054132219 /DNA_START=149 /DNA_END=1108 /DNA_ORIENTATION=-